MGAPETEALVGEKRRAESHLGEAMANDSRSHSAVGAGKASGAQPSQGSPCFQTPKTRRLGAT